MTIVVDRVTIDGDHLTIDKNRETIVPDGVAIDKVCVTINKIRMIFYKSTAAIDYGRGSIVSG